MDWLVQAFPEAIGGLIVIAVVSAIGWLWRRSRRTHQRSEPRSQITEPEERVGLVAIYESAHETRSSTLEEATRNFWFMGVSVQYICSADAFREIIRKRQGCQYRFLLLNPDSEYVEDLEREGMAKEVIASYIRVSIGDLMDMRERFNPNIEVKLYSELPTFRIIITNRKKCYVGFYSTTQGIFAPQMVFEEAASEMSFYIPFHSLFEQYWEKATPAERLEKDRREE